MPVWTLGKRALDPAVPESLHPVSSDEGAVLEWAIRRESRVHSPPWGNSVLIPSGQCGSG